jgi:hypothetical protein
VPVFLFFASADGAAHLASVTHREIARGAEVDQRISILAPSFGQQGSCCGELLARLIWREVVVKATPNNG